MAALAAALARPGAPAGPTGALPARAVFAGGGAGKRSRLSRCSVLPLHSSRRGQHVREVVAVPAAKSVGAG